MLKDVIHILIYVGTEQIRYPWPLLGFWRGLDLWPQFFALNQQTYVVPTCFAKKMSHSSPHMVKITKPNYLQILLHHPVFHKPTYSILQSAVKDDHLMTPSREPLVKAAEIPDYFLEPLFLVPDCDAWIDRLSPNSYYNRWEEGPRRSLQTPNKCKRFWAQLHFTIFQNEFKLKVFLIIIRSIRFAMPNIVMYIAQLLLASFYLIRLMK